MIINLTKELMNKFKKTINQIIANSDNNMEDMFNESIIVIMDNYDAIQNNNNIFINQLKKNCLKFNKYGKRIESKDRWEEFNNREENISKEVPTTTKLNEDMFYDIIDLKNIIDKEDYDFLIDYYNYGQDIISEKYGITINTARKRTYDLIKKYQEKVGVKDGRNRKNNV